MTTDSRFTIYVIRNRYTRWIYLGSTARTIAQRWKEHLSLLRIGQHTSKPFQADFDRMSEAAFEALVIETQSYREVEHWYLQHYPGPVYNRFRYTAAYTRPSQSPASLNGMRYLIHLLYSDAQFR